MNYKAGAQAGASTCQRHHPAQTFRLVRFIVGSMIHAERALVNGGCWRLFDSGSIGYDSVAVPDAADNPHHFEFDLDRGIRAQVVEKLEGSPRLPLTKGVGPQASGIYALYFKNKLVYIGKASKGTTKSKRTLRSRLSEHLAKIGSRQNISLADMKCRYLTFSSEWWVFAAEFALMVHYQPEWNESGFGSKVPGVGRPGTHRVSRWDELFPKNSR